MEKITNLSNELEIIKDINNELNKTNDIDIINYNLELEKIEDDIESIKEISYYIQEISEHEYDDLSEVEFNLSKDEIITNKEIPNDSKNYLLYGSLIGGLCGSGVGLGFGIIPSVTGALIGTGTGFIATKYIKK